MPLAVDPFRHRLLGRLVRGAPLERYTRGRAVRSPDGALSLLFVEEGHVRLLGRGGGEGRVVQVVGPGELEGVEALLGGGTALRPAVAGEPTVLRRIDPDGVRAILRRSRTTLDDLLGAMAEERALLEALVGAGPAASAPRRLAAVILALERRFGARGGPGIPFRLTHGVLADLAGVHRSTATTQVNDWLYRGVLAEEGGGWRLRDPDALRELASR